MQEQLDGLTLEIDEIKKLIFDSSVLIKSLPKDVLPSQKDLKDYSTKL